MNIQNPDIKQAHIQEVLSAAANVTRYAQTFVALTPEVTNEYTDGENISQLCVHARHWLHHIAPKIAYEIPQSITDFYEQFQLTVNNIAHISCVIGKQPGQKTTEEQHYAISDTLYDTLVQTGMHQKMITGLLVLIESYIAALLEDRNDTTMDSDDIKTSIENLLIQLHELQSALQTLRNAWNLTKLKFSTIISDIDGATNDYAHHLNTQVLQRALEEWSNLVLSCTL